jgi:hypothetical protein
VVVVAGAVARPEVVLRRRVELRDPHGRVRPNVYQRARGLDAGSAAELVRAAERIAVEQAAAALEETVGDLVASGAVVRSCAVVVGTFSDRVRLGSILASHALAHAAEWRLYQTALLQGAESHGLEVVGVPKASIWEDAEAAVGLAQDELRHPDRRSATTDWAAAGRGPEAGGPRRMDRARAIVVNAGRRCLSTERGS